jgi:hypothetical protein
MLERPESLKYPYLRIEVKILMDWIISRKPPINYDGILRDYT